METRDSTPRRRTRPSRPWYLALALVTGGGIAIAMWLALPPPARERPGVLVSAERARLGTCLSKALQASPELEGPRKRRAAPPLVSVLTHPESESSRVVFEGSTRLSFVVTLTDMPDGLVETRLQTMPPLDPGPAVDRAVAACVASAR